MSNECIALSDCLPATRDPATRIAFHTGRYYHADDFYADVRRWAGQLQAEPFQRYALYTEDAYPFAVLLFALFHAGKQAWISANNRPGTAQQLQQLDCRLIGDWDTSQPFDYTWASTDASALQLSPLNPAETRLVIFTSGSTGEPKPIEKCMIQFQLEIAVLEKLWGKQLGHAEVLATVSHQHIYGLLFRVLWPLSAGRCFHSPIYINPETLVNNIHGDACWVASPAHLKRLDQNSPWEGIAGITAVFSSGGALPEAAREQIKTHSGQQVIEIYGSSETGGIGWRQQDTAWQLFDGMRLSCIEGRWRLYSPYLYPASTTYRYLNKSYRRHSGRDCRNLGHRDVTNYATTCNPLWHYPPWLLDPGNPCRDDELHKYLCFVGTKKSEYFQLDDQISLQDDGKFILHGRLDRIVKIEEKRLSLSELERRLTDMPWVDDAFTVPIAKSRDVVAAAAVLTEAGFERLKTGGRNALIRELRTGLHQWFDAVVLPRKWLLLDTMPLTAQGKIDQHLLKALLETDTQKLPQVQSVCTKPGSVELTLRVPEELIYFPDHFAGYPILPGVVQIAWVNYFGRLFFAIDRPFLTMEVIKFVKVIQPADEVTLELNWNVSPDKLHFNFRSEHGSLSSGRLIYATKPREHDENLPHHPCL